MGKDHNKGGAQVVDGGNLQEKEVTKANGKGLADAGTDERIESHEAISSSLKEYGRMLMFGEIRKECEKGTAIQQNLSTAPTSRRVQPVKKRVVLSCKSVQVGRARQVACAAPDPWRRAYQKTMTSLPHSPQQHLVGARAQSNRQPGH